MRHGHRAATSNRPITMARGEDEASVVIACFTTKRWTLLSAAVESALAQSVRARDIIIVVDHNPDLQHMVSKAWPSVRVLANRFGEGASGARNTGAFEVDSPVVAFLDDDAVAEPGWLEALLAGFEDSSVVGVGGGVIPAWDDRRPSWFPDEFAWVVGASYPGLPRAVGVVRNVWAENMAVRTDRFLEVGGFRLDFGKVGSHSSPEDTDLCIRMASNGGRWLYVPQALITHHVPADRSTFRYFLRRSFHEGEGKAALAALTPTDSLSTEREYLRHIIPQAVGRGLRDALLERRLVPATRSGVIVIGLLAAGAGFGHERLKPRR